jgi:hypothetical protein
MINETQTKSTIQKYIGSYKILNWLFGKKPEKVESQPEIIEPLLPALPLEETDSYQIYLHRLETLEKRAGQIEESGCGCSRTGARDFIRKYFSEGPEARLAAYFAARDKIMSYCRNTQSSRSENNVSLIAETISSALKVIDKTEKDSKEKLINLYENMVWDLNSNLGNHSANKELITKINQSAVKLAREGDHYIAARILGVIAQSEKLFDSEEEMEATKALAKRYAHNVISNIATEKAPYQKKEQKIENLLRLHLLSEPVEKKAKEMLSNIEDMREKREEKECDLVRGYFSEKQYPIRQKIDQE